MATNSSSLIADNCQWLASKGFFFSGGNMLFLRKNAYICSREFRNHVINIHNSI